MKELDDRLQSFSQNQPFKVAWYLKSLASGQEADLDGDEVLAARSTRKVAIMMALLQAVNEGILSLSEPVTISPAYQLTSSGVTQHFLPGPVLRLRDAMTLMIITSDNGCTAALVDLVTLERINAFCASIGMNRTIHRNSLPLPVADLAANTTSTPRDQGLLLERILLGCGQASVAADLGCSTDHCALALSILTAQQLRSKIPARLPATCTVAHKDGTGPGMHHDTGIIFEGARPVCSVCVYTSEVPDELPDGTRGVVAAAAFIADFARMAWEGLRR